MRTAVLINCIVLLSLAACKQQSKTDRFMQRYQLQAYDSIYVVSCYSCSGCVKDFCTQLRRQQHHMLIMDTECNKSLLALMDRHFVRHISQASLDSSFGLFGNMLILERSADSFTVSTFP